MINRYSNIADRRKKRVRGKIANAGVPRLSVHKSNYFISAQIIDDALGVTLAQAKAAKNIKGAAEVGEKVAKMYLKLGKDQVVFDRGAWKYHGRIKELAESARKAGLKF